MQENPAKTGQKDSTPSEAVQTASSSCKFTVSASHTGERVDRFLSENMPDQTRSFLQKLIREQQVSVDGVFCKANYKLKEGQCVTITIPAPQEPEIMPENIPLDILYEDDDLLIVNKPKDMVVHPAPGHLSGTLVNAVMFHCKDSLSGINGVIRPGIVHRIDKDTTGSLIICKNDACHVAIAEQIKEHSVNRIYRGIVAGNFQEPEGTIEGDIGRHPVDRKKMAVVQKNGKHAVTHYRVLEQYKGASYLEFKLETGRTHQIRVHMSSVGHPLLGDPLYGNPKNPYHLNGQALHAMTIGFVHPTTGEYMEVQAPLPEYFTKLIAKFQKN